MDKRETVKLVVSTVASIGIGYIVDNAIKATTPSTIGRVGKLLVVVGGLFLSGMLANMAAKHVDDAIDIGFDAVAKVRDGLQPPEEHVENRHH